MHRFPNIRSLGKRPFLLQLVAVSCYRIFVKAHTHLAIWEQSPIESVNSRSMCDCSADSLLNVYIPVSHTNGLSIKHTKVLVMNHIVGIGL